MVITNDTELVLEGDQMKAYFGKVEKADRKRFRSELYKLVGMTIFDEWVRKDKKQ